MTTQSKTKAAKPTHRIYCVVGEGEKSNWTEIGAAWPNRDNSGFSMQLAAFPLTGRLVMREVKAKQA